MEKYYEIDPDEGSYFVYISNLTEEQKRYISKNIFIYDNINEIEETDDEIFDNNRTFKYLIDADVSNGIFEGLIKYLKIEGYRKI